MERTLTFLAGAGLGAGIMYLLDPDRGRRRRALARDSAVRAAHQAQDAAKVVSKDMSNRLQGLAAGDLSVLVGGRRALNNPLRGSWSPAARALMTLTGASLFALGLTQKAPTACIMGTAGLAMMAEGLSNAGLEDIVRVSGGAARMAGKLAGPLVQRLGTRSHDGRKGQPQAV